MQTIACRAVRHALLFALATAVVLTPEAALAGKQEKTATPPRSVAKTPKPKVVLGAFVGPKAAEARKWANKGLSKATNLTLVEDESAASVAPGSSDSDYASVAQGSGADVLVLGKVSLQKKVGWSVTLYVHAADDGKLVEKVSVRDGLLPQLREKLESKIGTLLAPALKKETGAGAVAPAAAPAAAAPAAAAPAAAAAAAPADTEGAEPVALEEEAAGASMAEEEEIAPPEDEETPSATSTVTGPSPLDLRLGMRFYQRSFIYSDTLNDYDPAYDRPLEHETAAGSPMFIFSGNLYPLAFFTTGALAHIGVMVGYESGFLTKTALPDPYDPKVDTRELDQAHTDVYVGVRYRLMLGPHELVPYVTFGKHSFLIYDDKYPYAVPGTDELDDYYDALPDVGYEYIDLGFQPRFQFGSFSVGGRAAYRLVNDTGGLQQVGAVDAPYDTWYPNAKGAGMTAGVQLGYAITPIFEILVGGDFTRYGFDFNHIPTAAERSTDGLPAIPVARVAGGATDTYVSGWLALGVRFSGSEITTSSASEAPASSVEDPDDEDVEELDF